MPSCIENPQDFRSNVVKKFAELLKDIEKNEKKAANVEKAIYNWSLKEATNKRVLKRWNNPTFVRIYVDRFRTIYFNVKTDSYVNNNYLFDALQNENVKCNHLSKMSHQEMCPDRWKKLIDDKIKRDKSKYEINMEASTDQFKCFKCKKNKCTYYELQTRSADEPMTTFVSCLNCGNRWKC